MSDARLQQLIREIGDAPAFPHLTAIRNADGSLFRPNEYGALVPGMTYRQWLSGRTLPECIRELNGDWRGTDDAIEDAFDYADAAIALLAVERMKG